MKIQIRTTPRNLVAQLKPSFTAPDACQGLKLVVWGGLGRKTQNCGNSGATWDYVAVMVVKDSIGRSFFWQMS